MLTLNAAIAFGFSAIKFSDGSIIKMSGNIFLIFALLSFLTCLIPLFPIISKIERQNDKKEDKRIKRWINKLSNWIDTEKSFENIHYFGHLKDINETEFENEFLTKTNSTVQFTKYETDLVTQILYNSRITWLKYQFFKIGAFSFLIGIIISTISLPIIKFINLSLKYINFI